jgi:hypothetical protein
LAGQLVAASIVGASSTLGGSDWRTSIVAVPRRSNCKHKDHSHVTHRHASATRLGCCHSTQQLRINVCLTRLLLYCVTAMFALRFSSHCLLFLSGLLMVWAKSCTCHRGCVSATCRACNNAVAACRISTTYVSTKIIKHTFMHSHDARAQVKTQHSRVQAAALVAPALLVVKPVGQAWQASWLPPAL